MKKSESTSINVPEKLDRKTVERNRRIHMKGLCFKLFSLIPPHHFKPSKDMLSQQDQLDKVATYIKQLKERIEELKERKQVAMGINGSNSNTMRDTMMVSRRLPLVELRDLGSTIEVILITGMRKNFALYQVISIIEEEGAEVVSASFTTVGNKVFHTLHAQVRVSRVGIETSRLYQRLQQLVSNSLFLP